MYVKLFSSITESSLWDEAKHVRLLFVSMLARADQSGFIEAAVPGLARMANLTIDEVVEALEILENPDEYSKNPTEEGRRIIKVPRGWLLVNYEEYRKLRNDTDRREYMRKYMQDYRKRKQDVNNVSRSKPQLAQAEAEAEAEAEQVSASASVNEKPVDGPRNAKEFFDRWCAWVDANGLGKIRKPIKLTAKRKADINRRLKDREWWATFRAALCLLPLADKEDHTWQPDLDWLIRNEENVCLIVEGKYDYRITSQSRRKLEKHRKRVAADKREAVLKQEKTACKLNAVGTSKAIKNTLKATNGSAQSSEESSLLFG